MIADIEKKPKAPKEPKAAKTPKAAAAKKAPKAAKRHADGQEDRRRLEEGQPDRGERE
jgi:hypothetical protein